jgi:hypothetical protein
MALLPMNSSAALLATLALTLPSLGDRPREAMPAEDVASAAPASGTMPQLGFRPTAPAPFPPIEEAHRPPVEQQVRIERRVIIRISPSRPGAVDRMMAELPRRPIRESFAEQPLEGCVPIADIAGVQPVPQNRLLLFMRDRRVISASLERACNSADFYSGFYVERQEDGALCSRRDRLQSRAGASCEVTQFHRLVAVRD